MISKINFEIFLLLLRVLAASCSDHPVIGILAQEFQSQEEPWKSYINTAYVKAIEGSGGLVVPILLNQNISYYKQILRSVNGVFIPGGYSRIQPGPSYYDAFRNVYEIAKKINEDEIYFPVLGVCLGFEALIAFSNNYIDPLIRCDVKDEYCPLEFTEAAKTSLMYSYLDESAIIMERLKLSKYTANNHTSCITLENFEKAQLTEEWKVLSTSTIRGLTFISSIEHIKYPFLGVQFHPDRYLSVWQSQNMAPYSWEAIRANRYFFDLLVDLAKENENKFDNQPEETLINNYVPRRWMNSSILNQVYVFL